MDDRAGARGDDTTTEGATTEAATTDTAAAEGASASLVQALLDRGLTLATAESLTGGLASHLLVSVPDSGRVHLGGIVAYSSETKRRVLGVSPGPVVSARCAAEMALGVQRLVGSDCALAFTGVAGPEPQEDRPVGTVFVAVRAGDTETVRELRLSGDPEAIRCAAVVHACDELHRLLTHGRA